MSDDVLARFSAPVQAWFRAAFPAPTPAQAQGWPAIAGGDHALILAPTGSGKTLTAFLWAIDRLMSTPVPPRERRLRVVYVSPLRALAVDVDQNLRTPLDGIAEVAGSMGLAVHQPEVGIRTGDTPPAERARMRRSPPDILITTPESLYLLLTSQARATLRGVEAVIVDEIHAMAATKRGSHLALTLERLEHEVTRGDADTGPARPPPQRIALSATQRPLEEIARFLGGHAPTPDGGSAPRPVTIVDVGASKPLELTVMVPVEDLGDLRAQTEPGHDLAVAIGAAATAPARRSVWPAIHPRLLDLVLSHRSTLIFVNARRQAERLAAKLNELFARRCREEELRAAGVRGAALARALEEPADGPPPELVRAHHGSLSRERRLAVEDQLRAGTLRGLVATSSLELGIDIGAVDLVVQVASPGSVARGLQRIGRAGHQVGVPSRGVLVPRFRGDLVESAVVAQRMHAGAVEATRIPRNPLDVLAQHIVAMVAVEPWTVDALTSLVRRATPFAELPDRLLEAVLDLLAGRYPSDAFAELRPRIVWDRTTGELTARAGAQRLAVTNPGTIPDRGLYGVFLPDGTRVGELDEEMVHESRAGETFVLGASTWRIEEITPDRVVVSPAPGRPGKLPFWHGDGPGRDAELGRAVGGFLREVREQAAADRDAEVARLREQHDLDAWAAENLVTYLDEQAAATGAVPDDRTLVVERFRDELGDWQVCVHSVFGARVNAPWAMAARARLAAAGTDADVLWADDGVVLRLAATDAGPTDDRAVTDTLRAALEIGPDEVGELVVDALAGTALFTTAFREAAGRALLLPRRAPGRRTALWQQRRRAADLLAIAREHPGFPLTLEATRECLQDVFDLPALEVVLRDLRARRVRVVDVETPVASPFARSLLFGWVGRFMYEYDAPLAERRAAALALDRELLRELLGDDELRELIDLEALRELERELQRLAPTGAGPEAAGGRETVDVVDRRGRDADGLHDVLRDLGPLSRDELVERAAADAGQVHAWLERLVAARRVVEVEVAGHRRLAAAEDAGRLHHALGTALPDGLPVALTEPGRDPVAELVARHARTHGPFDPAGCAARLGLDLATVTAALERLETAGRVVRGGFRPDGTGTEWVDATVLRRLKRRSLARLRAEVEPVDPSVLGRFLPVWQGVQAAPRAPHRSGPTGLVDAIEQLQGAPIPASVLEEDVLAARVSGYRGADLDELVASGEVVWIGVEPLGSGDGRLVLCFRDEAPLVAPTPAGDRPGGAVHEALRAHLDERGACFWPELFAASGVPDQDLVLDALWDLVWAGEVTNDTLAPVRAFVRARPGGHATSGRSRGPGRGRPRPGRLTRIGPPHAQGRWSTTSQLLTGGPSPTQRAHRLAMQLVARHGVLTREAVRSEPVRGGSAALAPVLRALEEAGHLRRGYAVAGLGAAQYAAPGAIDLLRELRGTDPDAPAVLVLAATDPAQPYGATLPWPASAGRPARTPGAHVVLVDGAPAAVLERGARSLTTFATAHDPAAWLPALRGLVARGRVRRIELVRVDGADVHATAWPARLVAAGFVPTPRGFTLRG